MTTARALAHNTAIQIIGKIISTALGLVAIGMMTRYLGAEGFGWYVAVISFLGFIGILIDFGLIPVTAQMMSEPRFDKNELFKNLLGFRIVTAIVFLGLAPLIALFFPYAPEVKIAIAFTTISFLCTAINQVLIGVYQTKLAMRVPAIGEAAGRVALIIGLFLVIHYGGSFLSIMAAVTLASMVYTLTLFLPLRSILLRHSGEFSILNSQYSFFNPSIWLAIIQKSWPIALSIMFNVVYLKGDAVLLSILRSETELGLYGAAYRVLDIVAQLAMMMMGVMLPLLAYAWSRDMKDEFRRRYQQSFDALMMVATPATIGAVLLAVPIMTLVAGADFAESGRVLRVLALAVFGVYLGAVFGHAAVAIDKQKQTIWIYVSDAILTLIGYLVFIPIYGMWGAAWMTVFSEFYAGILLFFTVRQYAKETLRWNTTLKIFFAGALMGVLFFFLPPLPVLLSIFIGTAVYGVVLYAIGGVSKETMRQILKTEHS